MCFLVFKEDEFGSDCPLILLDWNAWVFNVFFVVLLTLESVLSLSCIHCTVGTCFIFDLAESRCCYNHSYLSRAQNQDKSGAQWLWNVSFANCVGPHFCNMSTISWWRNDDMYPTMTESLNWWSCWFTNCPIVNLLRNGLIRRSCYPTASFMCNPLLYVKMQLPYIGEA